MVTPPPPGTADRLLSWFAGAARDLPWRRERSLYRTVVSEFMLQQTRVETVIPYFERWTGRFPGFAELAAAGEEEVVACWAGLGYYRRARNLHALAKALVAMPEPPRAASEWEKLPGVGPYTAAAIASLGCSEPAAVVDGNVVRVYARVLADRTEYSAGGTAVRAYREMAEAWLDLKRPGQFNEALMELGATVCTVGSPRCLLCPWSPFCASAGSPEATGLPRIRRREVEEVEVYRLLAIDRGRVLLEKREDTERRLAGFLELPLLPDEWRECEGGTWIRRTRGISNQRIRENLYQCSGEAPVVREVSRRNRAGWYGIADLGALSIAGPHRKWIEALA